MDRHPRSVPRAEGKFSLSGPLAALLQQCLAQLPVGRGYNAVDRGTDHLLERHLEHVAKTAVTVKDGALGSKRRRAFFHLFDEQAISVVSAFERVHLLALRPGDYYSIHLATADGAQGLFRFL